MNKENFTDITDFTDKFACKLCHIVCSRESEWRRHIITRKHLGRAGGSNLDMNKHTTIKEHICSKCSKPYMTNGNI